MRSYVIRRLLLVIPTIFLVSLITFFLVHLIPGDIIDSLGVTDPTTPLSRVELERKFGLDAPLMVQYGRWLGVAPQVDGSFSGVLEGDFGKSWYRQTPVAQLLATAWPTTFELGIIALIVAQLIALPIGIYSALRQDTAGDYIARTFAILCISVPAFWLATMVIVLPSIWWGYMPSIFLIPFTEDQIGNLKMFIVPGIILGAEMAGGTMRYTRTMMLEVLRQDYIRTAWAKGLRERVVTLRHALKNALIPVVTVIGFQLGIVIGGTVIIEQIFALPGVGRITFMAMTVQDEPIIMATVFLFGVVSMLLILLVDLTYAFLDPRVHYK